MSLWTIPPRSCTDGSWLRATRKSIYVTFCAPSICCVFKAKQEFWDILQLEDLVITFFLLHVASKTFGIARLVFGSVTMMLRLGWDAQYS